MLWFPFVPVASPQVVGLGSQPSAWSKGTYPRPLLACSWGFLRSCAGSWVSDLLFFPRDQAMITLWAPHRFVRKTMLCYPSRLLRRPLPKRSWTSNGLWAFEASLRSLDLEMPEEVSVVAWFRPLYGVMGTRFLFSHCSCTHDGPCRVWKEFLFSFDSAGMLSFDFQHEFAYDYLMSLVNSSVLEKIVLLCWGHWLWQ